MDIHAADINVPLPQIVSNSPTHSLPDVSYSGLEASASVSATAAVRTAEMTTSETPEVGTTLLREHSPECGHSENITSSSGIPLPVLQHAVSTSSRLEHTSDDTLPAEAAGFSQKCCDDNDDLLFFPLLDVSQDAENSVSLSSGCLHQQNGSVVARNDVRASDTVLSAGAALSNPQASSPSLERLRSGLRKMMRIKSQPNGSCVANPENAARCLTRQDSTASSRSGTGHWYGSSIFGSKLFESVSTSSFGSQRIHIIADPPSVELGFISCYSSSCDGSSFPRAAELMLENRHELQKSRFRTTSASSDLQSSRLSASGENVALQRTRSLPSQQAASAPAEFHEEVSDSVSELSHASASAAGSTTKRKWQMMMPELTEAPENNTLSTHGQKREHLAAAARAISRGEYKDSYSDGEREPDCKMAVNNSALPMLDICTEKRRYVKNLLVLSLAYFFLFSAYFALRNLQSSLNAELGLYALSSMYLSLVVGSFCSTMVVQRLQPKRALTLSLIGFVMYSAANFHPQYYTMIPASIVHGFFMAVGYTAHSTYLVNISAGYADLLGKQMKHVLSQFHGTYFIFLQFSQIAGGLISSLLLSQPVSISPDASYAGLLFANDSDHAEGLNGTSLYAEGVSASKCGSCLLYTSPSPRDRQKSRMPSSA